MLKQKSAGRYRLDYRRTIHHLPLVTAGEWCGGPWLIVHGRIEERYGRWPSSLKSHHLTDFLELVTTELKEQTPTIATLGEPFRRPVSFHALQNGAWIRHVEGPWHADADLIALAERATGRSDWSTMQRPGKEMPMPHLLLGTLPHAIVAPVWPEEIAGPLPEGDET